MFLYRPGGTADGWLVEKGVIQVTFRSGGTIGVAKFAGCNLIARNATKHNSAAMAGDQPSAEAGRNGKWIYN